MFTKELTRDGHTRTFMVNALLSSGWEVRVEQDRDVVRETRYFDWHRVERALGAIEREVAKLEAQGWQLTARAVSAVAQSTNR